VPGRKAGGEEKTFLSGKERNCGKELRQITPSSRRLRGRGRLLGRPRTKLGKGKGTRDLFWSKPECEENVFSRSTEMKVGKEWSPREDGKKKEGLPVLDCQAHPQRPVISECTDASAGKQWFKLML